MLSFGTYYWTGQNACPSRNLRISWEVEPGEQATGTQCGEAPTGVDSDAIEEASNQSWRVGKRSQGQKRFQKERKKQSIFLLNPSNIYISFGNSLFIWHHVIDIFKVFTSGYFSVYIYFSDTDKWRASLSFSWLVHCTPGAKDVWPQKCLLEKKKKV